MDSHRGYTAPTAFVNLSAQIYCVEMSPFQWSANLLCVAMTNKIAVGTIKFQEECDDLEMSEPFEWTLLREFHHGTRCHALCWAPESSITVFPKVILFCAAGADFKLRIISSNLAEDDTAQVLGGHTDYINAISWEPEGEFLASVGDDHTCRLWNVKSRQNITCTATFFLTSPGMDVCWHPEEGSKLLAAEKNGLIHLYNARSQQAILSIDAGSVPLMSAHWAPSNCFHVVAIAAGELMVWDISKPSQPLETRPLHEDGGRIVRFSPLSEKLMASIGRPKNTLKVTYSQVKLPLLTAAISIVGGLSWHVRLPYVCAGSDTKLAFWKVTSK